MFDVRDRNGVKNGFGLKSIQAPPRLPGSFLLKRFALLYQQNARKHTRQTVICFPAVFRVRERDGPPKHGRAAATLCVRHGCPLDAYWCCKERGMNNSSDAENNEKMSRLVKTKIHALQQSSTPCVVISLLRGNARCCLIFTSY